MKKNIEEVDDHDILGKLDELKVYEWSWKDQDDEERHMGPMAQDFYGQFGLGLERIMC
jgi:hypothetical protein